MLTYIIYLDDGRTVLVESQAINESEDALEFYNGQRLVSRFVSWQGWKLLGHVA